MKKKKEVTTENKTEVKEKKKQEVIKFGIYVDGAISAKNQRGGIGVVVISEDTGDEVLNYSSCYEYAGVTNNQMELEAAINGLRQLFVLLFNVAIDEIRESKSKIMISLYSDSAYVINGINEYYDKWMKNLWKTADGKPVKNRYLWKALYACKILIETKARTKCPDMSLRFVKVAGHSGDQWNEKADELAQIQAHGKKVNNTTKRK